MSSTQPTLALLAVAGVSMGLLGQTQGCDVSPIFNFFAPVTVGGNTDDSTTGGSDDPAGHDLNDDNGGINSGVAEFVLEASLVGPTPAHGKAVYRERGERRGLEIELEDASPGSVHAMFVGGVFIGDLTIGSPGEGEVEFDTEIEAGKLPWPDGLPRQLQEGTVIQVGDAGGTLGQVVVDNGGKDDDAAGDDDANKDDDAAGDDDANKDDDAVGDHDGNKDDDLGDDDQVDDDNGGDQADGTEVRFEAELKGDTAASGSADYRERGSRRRLKIEVEDVAPGTQLTMEVDGIVVGTLDVGSLGTAEVEFDTTIEAGHEPWPDALPDGLKEGATIQVGDLSGVLGE